ncbi:TPA: cation transporter [Candidatus Micrarchaeota archaeon]|nr:cation transporter [Candidatus Micrarchaeota archaeon]
MNQHTFYASGIECSSCRAVIGKAVSALGARLVSLDPVSGAITIECNPEQLGSIKEAVVAKGYALRLAPAACASPLLQPLASQTEKTAFHRAKKMAKGVLGFSPAYKLESALLRNALLSFFLLLAFEALAFLAFFSPNQSLNGWLPFILLIVFSTVLSVAAFWHVRTYRAHFNCMTGMMVGMTVGMIPGFLIGAIVGATNGMFVGSLVGMLVGMIAGAWCGSCAGVMGVMEGMMAGVMSGTMGAMLSVMMLSDNLLPFLAILSAVFAAIGGGLSYLVYKEAGGKLGDVVPVSFISFFGMCLLIAFGVTLIILYGPAAAVVWRA